MVLHAGLMIVSWKCDATRKRGSENIFDCSFYFFIERCFAPIKQFKFKLHSRNTGPYDNYKFDLYPHIPSRVVGCRTVVIRVWVTKRVGVSVGGKARSRHWECP